jgi:hypothetical protein
MYRQDLPLNGLATLAFGFSMLIAVAFMGSNLNVEKIYGPTLVSLVGDSVQNCSLNGVDTPFGHLGCNPEKLSHNSTHSAVRLVNGSKFVSARLN